MFGDWRAEAVAPERGNSGRELTCFQPNWFLRGAVLGPRPLCLLGRCECRSRFERSDLSQTCLTNPPVAASCSAAPAWGQVDLAVGLHHLPPLRRQALHQLRAGAEGITEVAPAR